MLAEGYIGFSLEEGSTFRVFILDESLITDIHPSGRPTELVSNPISNNISNRD